MGFCLVFYPMQGYSLPEAKEQAYQLDKLSLEDMYLEYLKVFKAINSGKSIRLFLE